jgi:hypothetical protein
MRKEEAPPPLLQLDERQWKVRISFKEFQHLYESKVCNNYAGAFDFATACLNDPDRTYLIPLSEGISELKSGRSIASVQIVDSVLP